MGKFLDEAGLRHYTEKMKSLLAGKQDSLKGVEGQVVGFDEAGNPAAQEMEELKGPAGKTAYQYAVDGGYAGTEEEFQSLLGTGPWLPASGGEISGDLTVKKKSNLSGMGIAKELVSYKIGTASKMTNLAAVQNDIYTKKYIFAKSVESFRATDGTYAASTKYVDEKVAALNSVNLNTVFRRQTITVSDIAAGQTKTGTFGAAKTQSDLMPKEGCMIVAAPKPECAKLAVERGVYLTGYAVSAPGTSWTISWSIYCEKGLSAEEEVVFHVLEIDSSF